MKTAGPFVRLTSLENGATCPDKEHKDDKQEYQENQENQEYR